MDKEHISRNAFAIYGFLDNNNGPRCLIINIEWKRYSKSFCLKK